MIFPAPDQFRWLLAFAAVAAFDEITDRDEPSSQALLDAMVYAAWPTPMAQNQ